MSTTKTEPTPDTVPGLRVARIWLDLTQEDAAADAGVSGRTYKKCELDSITPSVDVHALAAKWGLPVDVLLDVAPAVDYRRLRDFVAENGGIANVEAALRFLARLDTAAPSAD